jgi:hypothetical protein
VNIELLDTAKLKKEEVQELWDKVQGVPIAFDDRTANRPDFFVASLFNGTQYVRLGDFGIAALQNLLPGADANVHIVIWDDSHPAEVVGTLRKALAFGFKEFGLVRMTTVIGENNPITIRLAELLGFKQEGKLRKGTLFNGKWYDSVLLGLLREEFVPPREVN